MDAAAATKCIREIIESTQENQRAEYDLSAQEEMARWAFWVMAASFASLLATAVGVYFVKHTLQQARDDFVASHPPRIEIRQISLKDLPDYGHNPNWRKGEAFLFNSGSSEEAKIRIGSLMFWVNEIPPPPAYFEEDRWSNQLVISTISAGGYHIWRFSISDRITEDDIQTVFAKESKTRLYIVGRIHVEDRLGIHRHTVFCRVYCPRTRRFDPTGDFDYEYQR